MVIDCAVVAKSFPYWGFALRAHWEGDSIGHSRVCHPFVQGLGMDQVLTVDQLDKPRILFILVTKEGFCDLFIVTCSTLVRAWFPTKPYAGVAAREPLLAVFFARFPAAGLAAKGGTGSMVTTLGTWHLTGPTGLATSLRAVAMSAGSLAGHAAYAGPATGLPACVSAHLHTN